MASQGEALRLLLTALAAMRETGYTGDDVLELVKDAWDHLEGGGQQPHAFGHCLNCNHLIIGWSAYHWTILVREPCPRCGKPW